MLISIVPFTYITINAKPFFFSFVITSLILYVLIQVCYLFVLSFKYVIAGYNVNCLLFDCYNLCKMIDTSSASCARAIHSTIPTQKSLLSSTAREVMIALVIIKINTVTCHLF